MKKILLAVTILVALAGCGGGGSDTETFADSSGLGLGANHTADPTNPTNQPTNPNENPGGTRVLELVNQRLPGRSREVRAGVVAQVNPENSGILPRISADGRLVAFVSGSSDLVEGDINAAPDLFVRDMDGLRTVLVKPPESAPAGAVGEYAFSSDFQWFALWIGGNGTPPPWFLKNTLTSENYSGSGFLTDTSFDGSKVAFWRNGSPARIFVFDRLSGETIDITPTANGGSLAGKFSRDGTLLYFYSSANNLVPNDNNGVGDVFSYRFKTGEISRVSVLPNGAELNGESVPGLDSSDGRYYVFVSQASNIVEGDTNGVNDIFVKDTVTGELTLVSRAFRGPANGDSTFPTISGDGRFIVFNSRASNLVDSDTNSISDVFLYDREADTLLGRVSLTADNQEAQGGGDRFRSVEISLDGNWIVFTSEAENMIEGVDGGYSNVYRTNAVVPTQVEPPESVQRER